MPALQAESAGLEGHVIQVWLPLEIEGVANEYVFSFRIDDVQVLKLGG